jgi:hypothetical protein
MDFSFLVYIFLAFVIASGGAYALSSTGRTIAAIIFFVGIIAIEAYFGTRWFQGDKERKETAAITAWPPAINSCPDFLSLYKVDGVSYCVDTIGAAPAGGIAKWSEGASFAERPDYFFQLFTEQNGEQRVKSLCNECQVKKVTWEGVWDGATCLGKEPPKP